MDASESLQRNFDKIDIQLQRIMDRLDTLPNIYMSRVEYEARHKALEDDIKGIQEELRQFKSDRLTVWIALASSIASALVSIGLHFLK